MRILRTLKEADLIACEDTRNSIRLLNHFEIKTPMTSYHEYNKIDKAHYLVSLLLEGKNIALITDAGTPAISDPGEALVRIARDSGIEISSLPGPCALITALTVSGLPTRRFSFEAFLPADKNERKRILAELPKETRTIILYEAPHHLVKTLSELLDTLGNRRISLCRELTKVHEEVFETTLADAVSYYSSNDPRGEYVLVIEGANPDALLIDEQKSWLELSLEEHLDIYLSKGLDKKEAIKAVALDRGLSKRDVYNALVK